MLVTPVPAEAATAADHGCDLGGDGPSELVIGIRSGGAGAGSILVTPGGPAGLRVRQSFELAQGMAGVPGTGRAGDGFGSTIACTDIDGDGRSDLVVGAPGDVVRGRVGAGAVFVFYGTEGGIPTEVERWTLNRPGLGGAARRGDRFGSALTTGDFDRDGHGDIVVGAPGAGAGGAAYALYGAPRGLTSRHELLQLTSADSEAMPDRADRFGAAVGSGDLDGNGVDDIVVGIPGRRVEEHDGAGTFAVFLNKEGALGGKRTRVVDLASVGIRGTAQEGAALGTAIAVGDVDGDGRSDAAVGIPGQRSAGRSEAGAVLILFGSRLGKGNRDLLIRPSNPVARGRFGQAVASGDVSGDTIADLLVGEPAGDGDAPYSGRVEVRRGSPTEPLAAAGELGGSKVGEQFGLGLRLLDVNGDSTLDVAIGVPATTVGDASRAGRVVVAHGTDLGLQTARVIDRSSPGIPGDASTNEGFGMVGTAIAPAASPGSVVSLLPRSAWTDRDPITARLRAHDVDRITIHHAGSQSTAVGPPRFRSWQSWHMDGHEWGDIAYHYIIGLDGLIYRARDIAYAGDTATNYDPGGHLLIVVEGHFDFEHPTAVQLESLTKVVAWAAEEWRVSLDRVAGHRDHASGTTCPGANLYPFVASGQLHLAAQALIDAGGVWISS